MPLIVPKFISLDQTMYEKNVIIFYTILYFGTPGGPPAPKFTNLGNIVQRGPDYQCAKLRPILRTCLGLQDI